MTQAFDWQGEVGRKWARLHALTDRAFSGLTQHLLERLERLPGKAVLDIGCGAGELSLALARQRPQAEVRGVDISADLVGAAAHRASGRANVSFAQADAAWWSPGPFRPDLLVSRHGVMFFADPVAAFAHLREVAAPGASLLFSCFRDRRLNPWASELAAILPPEFAAPSDPVAPGPFAFAEDARVFAILAGAGWQGIRFEPVDFTYVVGVGADPVGDAVAFLSSIGPAAAAIEAMRGTPAEPVFHQRLLSWLENHAAPGMIALPAAAWIVTARRE